MVKISVYKHSFYMGWQLVKSVLLYAHGVQASDETFGSVRVKVEVL